jgi:hypothetical protein
MLELQSYVNGWVKRLSPCLSCVLITSLVVTPPARADSGGLASIQLAGVKSLGGSLQRLIRDLLIGRKPEPKTPRTTDAGDGGSHDRCPASPSGIPLVALVPPENLTQPEIYSKTLSPHPSLWFYIPYVDRAPAQTNRRLEFVLLDTQEQIVYENTFLLPQDTPGLYQLQIPKTVTLEPGQPYRWVFSIMCNPLNRSGDETVNGWIELVPDTNPGVSGDPEAVAIANLETYITRGLWYETVDQLARLMQTTRPPDSDLKEAWKLLLLALDLPEALASEPILPCGASGLCLGPTATRPGT